MKLRTHWCQIAALLLVAGVATPSEPDDEGVQRSARALIEALPRDAGGVPADSLEILNITVSVDSGFLWLEGREILPPFRILNTNRGIYVLGIRANGSHGRLVMPLRRPRVAAETRRTGSGGGRITEAISALRERHAAFLDQGHSCIEALHLLKAHYDTLADTKLASVEMGTFVIQLHSIPRLIMSERFCSQLDTTSPSGIVRRVPPMDWEKRRELEMRAIADRLSRGCLLIHWGGAQSRIVPGQRAAPQAVLLRKYRDGELSGSEIDSLRIQMGLRILSLIDDAKTR